MVTDAFYAKVITHSMQYMINVLDISQNRFGVVISQVKICGRGSCSGGEDMNHYGGNNNRIHQEFVAFNLADQPCVQIRHGRWPLNKLEA